MKYCGFFRNQKAGFSARLFELKTPYILFFAPQEKLFVAKLNYKEIVAVSGVWL